ncbi:MFS transporter [Rubrivivax rivuli]|uniref:MFS transporter n=1 Tax=Rubrivivax rivuli TaxID=1862385 RepID=A0A437RLC1_9BURK|nr:MFS transporter [Rubrivivax rivuli]RVU47578.1 MFS transporter [Rubrivivax rivuli]
MKPAAVVLALGTAQTLAWASSFYLPAMLAAPMAAELGLAPATVYALLSMALLISALLGPLSGRTIDRHGGRPVLMGCSLAFAAALALMAAAPSAPVLVLAWAALGAAMGFGLYDAAFAALVRLYGGQARSAITGITLLAGFASTVGWPLTAWFEATWGWRGACAAWAALHVLVGLPLNAGLPRVGAAAMVPPPAPGAEAQSAQPTAEAGRGLAPQRARRLGVLLAAVFAAMSVVSAGIATHLPALLQASGASLPVAVATAALMGPAQVAARLLELGWLRHHPPLLAARAAALAHPVAAGLLLTLGPLAAMPFTVVHGLGNGLVTIVRGTLPLAVFGSAGYGARQGWLTLPARVLGALSPWLFGLALARWGLGAVGLTAAVALAGAAGLWVLRLPAR